MVVKTVNVPVGSALYNDILRITLPLLKQAESFRSKPYLCPAGKWTIGYGTTFYPASVPGVGGQAVKQTDSVCTEPQATGWLMSTMSHMLDSILKLLTHAPTATQGAALLSLCYNIGVGCHDGKKGDFADSDLLSAFNAGDMRKAASEFLLWNKITVNGQHVVDKGLTARRQREHDLFLS